MRRSARLHCRLKGIVCFKAGSGIWGPVVREHAGHERPPVRIVGLGAEVSGICQTVAEAITGGLVAAPRRVLEGSRADASAHILKEVDGDIGLSQNISVGKDVLMQDSGMSRTVTSEGSRIDLQLHLRLCCDSNCGEQSHAKRHAGSANTRGMAL